MKTFLKVVRELAKILNRPKVPSLGRLKKYRKTIPNPQVIRRETKDGAPFYQISVLDIVCMQTCRNITEVIQYPDVVEQVATSSDGPASKSCSEMWHGTKWRWELRMQRPMEIIWIQGRPVSIWIGDVLRMCPSSSTEYALYYDLEIRFSQQTRENKKYVIGAISLILLEPVNGCIQGSLLSLFLPETVCWR
ncbi:hypothetical protein K470DRAFT_47110 [Piedraia hortae CBS 480.64]|uniref:Uncharacterized protein n=1 Tax=Piedraia hortae CBS 480.64 TaxID=1314780 RepID=A0A6A7C0N5_9PEZI|nr:hypothetical protein K470DRAFT_47110 [Piedraia hortae CBS 480.64]